MLRLRKAQVALIRLIAEGADLQRIAPNNGSVPFYRVLNAGDATPISARSVEYLLAWRFVAVVDGPHYVLGDNGRLFIERGYACPLCNAVSFNPNDRDNRYCGHCHEYAEPTPKGYYIARERE